MSLRPNDLSDAIETAFERVWGELKPDEPFPSDGRNDRRLLFRAIARGLLTYLEQHENDFATSIRLTVPPWTEQDYTIAALSLNTDLT